VAELVIIGERAAATIASETAKLDSKKHRSSDDPSTEEEKQQNDQEYIQIQNKIAEQQPYASIFDLFFERNGLELITDDLTGKAFDLLTHVDRRVKEMEMLSLSSKIMLMVPTRKQSWNDLTSAKPNLKSWMNSRKWKNTTT
jgi:hypothetical protein